MYVLLLLNQVSNAEIRIFAMRPTALDSPNNWYTYRLDKHFWYTIYTNKYQNTYNDILAFIYFVLRSLNLLRMYV